MKKAHLASAITTAAALLLATSAHADARPKIFVTIAKSGDKFIDILRNSVTAEAAKYPDLDVTVVIANNDAATQQDQVKQAIADHADVVVILPVDGTTATITGNMAASAKTPIVYLNRRPPTDRFSGRVSIVSSNDLVAGRLQMRLIAERLKNSGNIVILRGEEGHPAAIERTQGVKEILATRAGIHLVAEAGCDWKRDKAEAQVTQWLQSGQHIDAILANNDEMALGAIDALKKANIPAGKIAVAGVDGTADALAAIRSGYLTMSFLQNANAQSKQALTDAKAFAGKQYAELYDWVP
ncbi:MAG: substrate-binding domain-containing protein, partial [Asticcacaulis sp.]